jgi:outer membrane scaffolding protein for murein synthesis (MipA/OmpV family)
MLLHGVCAAESQGEGKFEASYGFTRTNQSLIKGVLIRYQTDPSLNMVYENSRGFASIQNSAGFWLLRNEQLKTGISANYMLGRNSTADSRYVGMGNVPGSPTAYVWAEWQPLKDAITLYANHGRSLSDFDASLGQWGFTLGLPVTRRLNFFVDHSRSWGSRQYIRQYYGVTASQSLTSGYREFAPKQGGLLYKNTQIGLALEAHKNIDLILGYGMSSASNGLMRSQLMDQRVQPITTFILNQRFNSE